MALLPKAAALGFSFPAAAAEQGLVSSPGNQGPAPQQQQENQGLRSSSRKTKIKGKL
jgi:hypothetical protein